MTRQELEQRLADKHDGNGVLSHGWHLDGAGTARYGWGWQFVTGKVVFLGRTLEEAAAKLSAPGRPVLTGSKSTPTINYRVSAALHESLTAEADRLGVTRNELARLDAERGRAKRLGGGV